VNTNIRRLANVFLIIFLLVTIDLVYWQVIDAGSLNSHAENPRALITADHVLRGRIFDRNGMLLVGRRIYKSGFVQPFYTDPSLAQTLGYDSVNFGKTGLESSLNSYLSGQTGTSWKQTFNSWIHRPVRGDDVYLTIDERIQQAVVNALNNPTSLMLANSPNFSNLPVAVVVSDPRNGQVLAMVSKPYFDPTCLGSPDGAIESRCEQSIAGQPNGPFVNRVLNGLYAPGSTFKMVTLSAALDSGVKSLSDQFNGTAASGPIYVEGHQFGPTGNNLPAGVTSVDLLHAFMYSDNIVFAQVGLSLGAGRFLAYAHRFGLDQNIPFDLPVSVSHIRNPGQLFDRVALASSAFGQGDDHVTPMQMLLVGEAIADHGTSPKPVLIKAIKTPAGTTVRGDSSGPLFSPISPSTSAQVVHAMSEVVNGGSGYYAQIPGVQVAGKTGTAEAGPGGPHAWFVAFAPAQDPRVAVAIIVEHGGEGAYVAAPLAQEILSAALPLVH